jgi:hypothetical protein
VRRYPGHRARSLMRDNLGVPDYRPAFREGVNYLPAMTPFLDDIVEQAQRRARSVKLSLRGERPVLRAMQGADMDRTSIPATRVR